MVMATSVRSGGSSPLARGLPAARLRRLFCVGIIPARAGFTPGAGSVGAGWWDHPRSRGVYMNPFPRRTISAGSSPLARGLRTVRDVIRGGSGIIPARAGFTSAAKNSYTCAADHPRSRGVYAWCWERRSGLVGSSPLARGLHEPVPAAHDLGRIIPARAGFTNGAGCDSRRQWDHPRSRGVYEDLVLGGHGLGGSSPLARGLQTRRTGRPAGGGIIPARAGFTHTPPAPRAAPPDHPRSRGVYGPGFRRVSVYEGSSPLARGLPRPARHVAVQHRIIPARAGFTCAIRAIPASRGDHPRSRGVYETPNSSAAVFAGSSPLARGLPR
mgnify:FL=1